MTDVHAELHASAYCDDTPHSTSVRASNSQPPDQARLGIGRDRSCDEIHEHCESLSVLSDSWAMYQMVTDSPRAESQHWPWQGTLDGRRYAALAAMIENNPSRHEIKIGFDNTDALPWRVRRQN